MKYYLILLSENYADMPTDEIYNTLLAKSAIAAELAHRDIEIERLRTALAASAQAVPAQAAPVDAENEIDLLAEAALCERLDACLAAARAAQKEAND